MHYDAKSRYVACSWVEFAAYYVLHCRKKRMLSYIAWPR